MSIQGVDNPFEKPEKGSLELIDDEFNNNQMMQQNQRAPR